MPRLSILIPCLGGAAEFDAALVSVLQHRPDDCEVLVVHTEPYDDPYSLAGEVSFVQAARAQSLVELINLGLEAAQGEIVHLVSCGLEVEEGWTDAALRHFDDEEVAAVAPVVLAADRSSVASAGMMWTLGGTRRDCRAASQKLLGPTIHAGFWRRAALTSLDGLDVTLGDELADVGLGLALRDLNCTVVCEPESRLVQVNDQPKRQRSGPLVTGRRAERLFWRQTRQASFWMPLALHPLAILGDCLRLPGIGAALALLGRLLALTELGAARQYERRLLRADRGESQPATVPLAAARPASTRTSPARKAA